MSRKQFPRIHLDVMTAGFPYVLFILILAVYSSTVCPFIYWKDSGELTSATASMGICHPSGYPVYTLVGFLMSRLPAGDIAYRLNLFSALMGAATAAALFILLRRVSFSLPGAVAGAIIPVLAHEIWLESSVNEIYSFSLLLFVLTAMFLTSPGIKDFYMGFFCLGLALAHHLTMVLLMPAYVILAWHHLRTLTLQKAVCAALIAGLSMSSLMYLPVRSHQDPTADFGNPETIARFCEHYLTEHYKSKMWPESFDPVIKRVKVITLLLLKQYGPGMIMVSLLGCLMLLALPKWRFFTVFYIGAHGAFLLYPPDHSFLIPLICLAGITIAVVWEFGIRGLSRVHAVRPLLRRSLVMILTFGLVLIMFIQNYALVNKSDHTAAWLYSRELLNPLPHGSVIMTNGDNGFSLVRYEQFCEGYRPDIVHLHRPMITWPDHIPKLRQRFPDWFSDVSRLEGVIQPEGMQLHPEAADSSDFSRYTRILARLSESAMQTHSVYWEGGSDISGFYRFLTPEGLLYRFSLSSGSWNVEGYRSLDTFWERQTAHLMKDGSFLMDHNAVSEYTVVAFNLGNYFALKGNSERRRHFLTVADHLWRSQLDPEPHNVLVENMVKWISPGAAGN
jgi:Protein O-mannosyl-transferase TMEM260-like